MPARCEQCGSEEYMPYACKFCQGKYCAAHRLPENHSCAGLEAYRRKAREEGRLVRPVPDVMSPQVSAGARASMSMDALWAKVQGKMTYVFLGIVLATFLVQSLLIASGAVGLHNFLFVITSQFYLNPWTILTSIFAHASINHLFFNGLFLFFFGTTIERLIGTRRFTWLFLGAGALAGILQVVIFPVRGAVGASGALMGLAGTLVFLAPRLTVYVMGIIPAPMWAFGLFYVFMDVVGLINPTGNIAHLAHLAGFAVGAVYGHRLKQHGMRVHNPRPTIRRNF